MYGVWRFDDGGDDGESDLRGVGLAPARPSQVPDQWWHDHTTPNDQIVEATRFHERLLPLQMIARSLDYV